MWKKPLSRFLSQSFFTLAIIIIMVLTVFFYEIVYQLARIWLTSIFIK